MSDSEDDCGFLPIPREPVVYSEGPTDVAPMAQSYSQPMTSIMEFETSLILKDCLSLESCSLSEMSGLATGKLTSMAVNILYGNYIDVILEVNDCFDHVSLVNKCVESVSDPKFYLDIRSLLTSYVSKGENHFDRQLRCLNCLLVGIAYLELYCQANYTGPELPVSQMNRLTERLGMELEVLNRRSLEKLEVDGEFPFPTSEIPWSLLIARSILAVLADVNRGSWNDGIYLSSSGEVLSKKANDCLNNTLTTTAAFSCLVSSQWWSVRALNVHLRLLPNTNYDKIPTLFKECQDMWEQVLSIFGGDTPVHTPAQTSDMIDDQEEYKGYLLQKRKSWQLLASSSFSRWNNTMVLGQMWLENGLCKHYFSFADKGKSSFIKAQESVGLRTELTAAMGKRTKHQRVDYAQLFLRASSSLLALPEQLTVPPAAITDNTPSSDAAAVTFSAVSEVSSGDAKETEGSTHWEHSEWEMGKRLIVEAGTSDPSQSSQPYEEAAVREVLLDSADGGAQENILLEEGIKFSPIVTASGTDGGTITTEVDKGTDLHPIDQAIVLSLCLDVANSNPKDGLTDQEMRPYLDRVLQNPHNWMIHSTGLLERSWLEYEKRRSMDRAMLQIQALIDQHTTKLTMLQSTRKSAVEEAAPVQDRMLYLYNIVYPAQYELKRDLAIRYLQCSVFSSALNFFKELELWDEVVTCYQLMQKPHRAEIVVRERLNAGDKTPYMLTALGDLTSNTKYYEEAWELSNHRYARAKRTLGKICYDKGDWQQCVDHLVEALFVQPLVPHCWYLKGIACMRLEDWSVAIEAFMRCTQQEEEVHEAWGNIGAIYMRLNEHSKAFEAFREALKIDPENWKITENMMIVCLKVSKFTDAINTMNKLLDMRHKSKRPVHIDELRQLAFRVAMFDKSQAKKSATAVDVSALSLEATGKTDSRIVPFSKVGKNVEKLILRISNTVKSTPEVWDILAAFHESYGRLSEAAEWRLRQFRSHITEANWERNVVSVKPVLDCVETTVEIAAQLSDKKDCTFIDQFLSILKTAIHTCRTNSELCAGLVVKEGEEVTRASDAGPCAGEVLEMFSRLRAGQCSLEEQLAKLKVQG